VRRLPLKRLNVSAGQAGRTAIGVRAIDGRIS
jgi:hypothetical protein